MVTIRSGLDQDGRVSFWEHHVLCAGEAEADPSYDYPNQKITMAGGWMGGNPAGLHPFPIGPWRAPAANTNVYAREAHMDALAALSHADPLAFRLRHVSDPRMVAALKEVAKAFGWVAGPAPSGRGFGVACAVHRNTVVAAMAEVAVDRKTGAVQVKRVAMVQDMGLVVNPDGARQQMEGSITMGLGYALTEEVRFKNGRILDENFDTYRIPRFSGVPDLKTILLPNPGLPAQAGGSPPSWSWAVSSPTPSTMRVGIRLLQLPMTPERVLKALKV